MSGGIASSAVATAALQPLDHDIMRAAVQQTFPHFGHRTFAKAQKSLA